MDRPILVSLEALVPADHFYRRLDAALDLSFVREWVKDLYAERGRPSIDPVVFFRLQLAMFFEGLRSERHLMRLAEDRLSLRWYLGYDFHEVLPDHSSLTRIRERYGVTIFERFFERVVELCQEAGLIWGKELFFDATKVRANADIDSLVPRFYQDAKQHVDELFGQDETGSTGPDPALAAADSGAPAVLPVAISPQERQALETENAARWSLLEKQRLDPERPASGPYRRISDFRVSTTDPDATPMVDGRASVLGYQDHYVVDGGKARIILAALVTPADVMENAPMLDLLGRVRFRWKLRPRRVVADTAYGTGENLRALEEAGIRAYVPLADFAKTSPFFGQKDFTYHPDRDVYTCPQGEELRLRGRNNVTGVWIYQAPTVACRSCLVRERCTESTEGRKLNRPFDEEYRERVRGYHDTEAYAKAMRKRKVWIEPLFAEAKDWHGLRRFRLRGLDRVNIEAFLVAAGQNLKRWLSHQGWGRRPCPAGGAGWPSPSPSTVIFSP